MKFVVLPLVVLWALACVALWQRAYYIPRLPDRVAAHIGPSGKVDRLQDKADFVAGVSWSWLVVPAIFAALGALAVLGVRYLPPQFVNLPNKDYWLASPERRLEAAMVMLNFFLWLTAGGAALGVGINQAMIEATLAGNESITLPLVVGFILFLVARIILLLVRLARGPEAGD
jgi:hypothetical protein